VGDGERLLTREEFEALTSIGEHMQRTLARAGQLREVKLGYRTVRIPLSEVARLAQTATPATTQSA
jgi:hypothetical protein